MGLNFLRSILAHWVLDWACYWHNVADLEGHTYWWLVTSYWVLKFSIDLACSRSTLVLCLALESTSSLRTYRACYHLEWTLGETIFMSKSPVTPWAPLALGWFLPTLGGMYISYLCPIDQTSENELGQQVSKTKK